MPIETRENEKEGHKMVVAGLDIGHRSVKLVILEDGRILSKKILNSAGETNVLARQILDQTVEEIGLQLSDIKFVTTTGGMGKNVSFSNLYRTVAHCLAKGVHALFPKARTIIDMGGETCNVVKLNEMGEIEDTQSNDKCAAGTGIFFEAMAKLLGTSLEEMGRLATEGEVQFEISSMCVMFAEQEVISHCHENPDISAEALSAGIHLSIAERVAGLAKRLGITEEIVLTGGVAKNAGFVKFLSQRIKATPKVAEDPQIVAAYGAALIGQERIKNS
jgi:(R)-2-hydroxyacyl-CoA dehydratese activating ATPase